MPNNSPKSIKELFAILLKSPELRNFTIQYMQFKIVTLLNKYCIKRWNKKLVREVFWTNSTLLVKVSEPALKRELSFHSEAMLAELKNAGFKFSKIKFV